MSATKSIMALLIGIAIDKGQINSVDDKVLDYLDHDYIKGLSLLGGEPLEPQNQEGLLPLVKKVKERFPNKDIWCYTGFDFENDVILLRSVFLSFSLAQLICSYLSFINLSTASSYGISILAILTHLVVGGFLMKASRIL